MNRQLACLVMACFGLSACQPLYGGKPEHLNHPAHKRRPAEKPETAAPVKYVEECTTDFTGNPAAVHPQTSIARQLVDTGNTSLASSEKAKDDNAKVGLLKDAIDRYRSALIKDPFNVEATLKLAVAYDRALRKGCAIAMLKRLADLSNNPKWANEANRDIDSIDSNASWFRGYRKDAMSAVGR
jgi:hypothetical protein